MSVQIWNERYQHIEIARMNGTAALNGTLDNSAVVNSSGYARIKITGHGLTAGCKILIAGTTNYDGVQTVVSVEDANYINTGAAYVAETPAGTETYALAVGPVPHDFQLVETRFVLGGAAAAENYLVKLDANAGSGYDATLQPAVDMDGLSQHIKVWIDGDQRRYFDSGDIIYYTFANSAADAWSMTTIYRRKV